MVSCLLVYDVLVHATPPPGSRLAVSSSPRPWIDVFASLENNKMAVSESDPERKVQKMSITF